MPSCKNGVGSYTGKEPSPKGRGYCARHEKIGTKKRGRDKKMWVVKSVKLASGKRSRRWFKVLPPAKKSKVKPTKRKRPTFTQKRKATAPTRKRKPTTQKRKAPARKMSTSTRKRKATAPTRKRKPTTQRRKRLRGGGELTKYERDLLLKYIGDKWFRKNGMDVPKTARQCSPICAAWLYKAWESNQTSFYLPTTEEKRDQLKNYFSEIQADGSDYRQNSEVAKKCIDQFYEWLQSNYDPTQTTQASYTAQASYTPAHTPSGQSSIEKQLNKPPLDELARQFEDLDGDLHKLQKLYIQQFVRIMKLRRGMELRYIPSTKQDREMAEKYYLTFQREIAKPLLGNKFPGDVFFRWENYLSSADEKHAVASLIKEFVGHPKYEPEDPNIIRMKQGLYFEPTITELKRLFNTMPNGSDAQKKLFCDILHKIDRKYEKNQFDKIITNSLKEYEQEFLNIAKNHLEEQYVTGALEAFKERGMRGLRVYGFYPE